MPERCPGDHPHLYSFFKHENKFYRVGEGDFFGGPFFLIQSNSWLADSAVAPFEGNESEARRKGRCVLFLIPSFTFGTFFGMLEFNPLERQIAPMAKNLSENA